MQLGSANGGFNSDDQQQSLSVPSSGLPHSSSQQNILDNTTKATNFIQETFPGAHLVEQRQVSVEWISHLRWSLINIVNSWNSLILGKILISVDPHFADLINTVEISIYTDEYWAFPEMIWNPSVEDINGNFQGVEWK